jgi:UDP-2,3-diacylglucosamine pyrophosphatase LpxH
MVIQRAYFITIFERNMELEMHSKLYNLTIMVLHGDKFKRNI